MALSSERRQAAAVINPERIHMDLRDPLPQRRFPPVPRSLACLLLILVTLNSPRGVAVEGTSTLSAKDIQEAIDFGTYDIPQPYLLHTVGVTAHVENRTILGAVYTPFVRVALAAHAAHTAGRELRADEVSSDLTDPIIYVAFRWYCCDEGPGQPRHWSLDEVLRRRNYHVDWEPVGPGLLLSRGDPPLWISYDLSRLNAFGEPLPYDDIVLIAAFPMAALRSDHLFVIYHYFPGAHGRDTNIRPGLIRPDELKLWR
jgi:hypothetical protein